ncbi:polymer-forming cytoskeletal protein [Cohnella luojiensis]|nr:polymer-forming cytoskeletal protein [Cohnella luojiensis]
MDQKLDQIHKPNLIINGVSSAGGGDYDKVKIDGVGTINGHLNAAVFHTNGITKVYGNLQADEMDCDGMIKIDGHLSAGKSVVDGTLKVKGSVRSDHFTVNGLLRVEGDCEVETMEIAGSFEVNGLLNAGRMNANLHWKSQAKEIGVEFIKVRRVSKSSWSKLWRWMLPKAVPGLKAEVIEGDDIDLEYTEADIVRGNRIRIGKGCSIGRVEYRTELNVIPGAKIGEEVKTGD